MPNCGALFRADAGTWPFPRAESVGRNCTRTRPGDLPLAKSAGDSRFELDSSFMRLTSFGPEHSRLRTRRRLVGEDLRAKWERPYCSKEVALFEDFDSGARP